jgi:hypothetical protein
MERASHGADNVERRLEAISAKGDPLETIRKLVQWEDFRTDIEAVTETKAEERKRTTIVSVPKQRNSKEENEAIKAGKTPEGWEKQPAKNTQKDKTQLRAAR